MKNSLPPANASDNAPFDNLLHCNLHMLNASSDGCKAIHRNNLSFPLLTFPCTYRNPFCKNHLRLTALGIPHPCVWTLRIQPQDGHIYTFIIEPESPLFCLVPSCLFVLFTCFRRPPRYLRSENRIVQCQIRIVVGISLLNLISTRKQTLHLAVKALDFFPRNPHSLSTSIRSGAFPA